MFFESIFVCNLVLFCTLCSACFIGVYIVKFLYICALLVLGFAQTCFFCFVLFFTSHSSLCITAYVIVLHVSPPLMHITDNNCHHLHHHNNNNCIYFQK